MKAKMATIVTKYQSPKRKRSNSSENSKKARDQELSFQIQFTSPVNSASNLDVHVDKYLLPEGLEYRSDWHEPSKSGNTTVDHSDEVNDVSLLHEHTTVASTHLVSPNSSSSSAATTRLDCSDRIGLCRDVHTDMTGLRSQSILQRSPIKINRQFIPFQSTGSCSCSGVKHCSGCNRWRRSPVDDDCSDDENTTNVQLHMNFSDDEFEHEHDAHSKDDMYSDHDANLVAGPMSTLNVSRRRRPCFDERNPQFLAFPDSSPDLFSESQYRDSPISRFSSPDLGYVGTPVLEIESSVDLDEALLLDSSISVCLSNLTNIPTPRRDKESESSVDRHVDLEAYELRRPVLPDHAFERKVFRSPTYLTKTCPATPIRGPNPHAQQQQEELYYTRRGGAISLARQNSLVTNKVLLSQSEVNEGSDVSFYRDFEDEGVLGAGQFSTVFLGRAKDGSNRVCAIKKLNTQFRNRKERDFHLKEVRIMESIGKTPCEFVIHFFTAWQEEGHLYVDIEFAANGTLKDLINDQTYKEKLFEETTIWCILHDVTAGLQHIHGCGFVHLDIKPANILIAENGVMKIADFGCAVEVGANSDGSEGDTRYMAVELLDSNSKMPSADVFSLGLTVYEVCLNLEVSGLPLDGPEWHNLREERAPCITDRSAALVGVVTAMMRRDVQQRISVKAILAMPQIAHAKSSEDPVLTTCKPDRPLYSRHSASLSAINSQQDHRSIDDE